MTLVRPSATLAIESCRVELVTIEGEMVHGKLTAIDRQAGLTVSTDDGLRTIPIDELMLVSVAGVAATQPAPWAVRLYLDDGGELTGSVVGSATRGIRVATSAADQTAVRPATTRHANEHVLAISFSSLAGIRWNRGEINRQADEEFRRQMAKRAAGSDVVIAVKDKQVTTLRGAMETLGPDGGAFSWRDRILKLRNENLYGIIFGASPRPVERPPVTVELADGSKLCGRVTAGNAQQVIIESPIAGAIKLPTSRVRRMSFRSDRIVFISDLVPSKVMMEPYFNTLWQWRRDRSVANRPLRMNKREYKKGIGLHSHTELTYELKGEYGRLAATIGIDDEARPQGNVIFRVLADGEEVFRSPAVRGTDAPKDIVVDVTGAGTITLIVDFGDELDLGDHADWASARLIRPQSLPPTTQGSGEPDHPPQ